jgi:8-oxo-dGTP pyrophosphatase MutT (NUDIX family)
MSISVQDPVRGDDGVMTFEPQKLFIGLVDFFSVILPGALLAYLLKDDLGPWVLGESYYALGAAEQWIVLIVAAYLLGHVAFLIGSWLLDDRFYDKVRKATPGEQARRLADCLSLSGKPARFLARVFFKKEADRALHQALRIKRHHLDPIDASEAINAFQWCKARLTLEEPEALATVQRFEADSKFFRSLVVVLLVIIPWGLWTGRYVVAGAGAPLLVMALWRYVDLRIKSTNQAYWYIITLEGRQKAKHRLPGGPASATSHAGGVVFRTGKDGIRYLIVQARCAPREWVLPKGHIEPGEPPAETAVREVREETGVWAKVLGALDKISFSVDGKEVTVAFYLMEYLEEGRPSDEGRVHVWLPLEAALKRATHPQSQRLLQLAEQTRGTKAATAVVQSG